MSEQPDPPFGTLKQVDAGLLSVGYAEAGPADGRAVILLHGWPYDIHSYAGVTPVLAAAGYRVIVPYLRGYGTTRFLSGATFRNGQQSVLGVDVIALMDALDIGEAIIGGFDWGARTANVVAALWPGRCQALVSVSGYLISSQPNSHGGISFISPPNAARPGMTNTGASLESSSGILPRRNGTSTTRRSTGAPRPLTTQIMSAL